MAKAKGKTKFNEKHLSPELKISGSFVIRKDYAKHSKCKKSNLKDGTQFCDTHFLVLRHEIK